MTNGNERLANPAHVWIRGEGLPSGLDAPDDRVLDWNHARVGLTFLHRAHRTRKSGDRNSLDGMLPDLRDRALGVRAMIALERDAHRLHASRLARLLSVGARRLRCQHDHPLGLEFH